MRSTTRMMMPPTINEIATVVGEKRQGLNGLVGEELAQRGGQKARPSPMTNQRIWLIAMTLNEGRPGCRTPEWRSARLENHCCSGANAWKPGRRAWCVRRR